MTITFDEGIASAVTPEEGAALYDLASKTFCGWKGREPSSRENLKIPVGWSVKSLPRLLELGSFLGRSTLTLASSGCLVHSVDWHRGDPHSGVQSSAHGLLDNLTRHGMLGDRITPHIGRFEHILPLFAPGSFAGCFIDASHDAANVTKDARAAAKLVANVRGAWIAFHDCGRFGVDEGIGDWLYDSGSIASPWRFEVVTGSLGVAHWRG